MALPRVTFFLSGWLAFGALGATACGDDASAAPASAGGSGGSAAGRSSGGGGSAAGGGGADAAGGAGSGSGGSGGALLPLPAKVNGTIVIVQRTIPSAAYTAVSFFRKPNPKVTEKCEAEEEGACRLTRCTRSGPVGEKATLLIDAGPIAIAAPTNGFELLPDPGRSVGSYDLVLAKEILFTTGEAVSATAEGSADFGAFSVTVKAPAPLLLLSPVEALTGEMLKRTPGDPLTITWKEDNGGTVLVSTSGSISSENSEMKVETTSELQCAFVGAALTGTIASAFLDTFYGQEQSIIVGSVARARATAGDKDADLLVQITAATLKVSN